MSQLEKLKREVEHWKEARRNSQQGGEILKAMLDKVRQHCDNTLAANKDVGNPSIANITGYGKADMATEILEILSQPVIVDAITSRAQEILKRPYAPMVYQDGDGFSAHMMEFPGCLACGDTHDEAHKRLMDTAQSWVEVQLANEGSVPIAWADWYSFKANNPDHKCKEQDMQNCDCKGACSCHWVMK